MVQVLSVHGVCANLTPSKNPGSFSKISSSSSLQVPGNARPPSLAIDAIGRRDAALGVIGACAAALAMALESPGEAAAVTGGARYVKPETRLKLREEIKKTKEKKKAK